MKKFFVFLFAILLTSISTFAQSTYSGEPNDKRTVISTRPLSLIIKQPNIKIEHAFGPSFSAGGELTYFTGLNSGIKIDPFIRLYTGKNSLAPEGFYIQGKFSYGNHESETSNLTDQVDVEIEQINNLANERFDAIGGAFGVGHQWFTGKSQNLSIDFYGGVRRYAPTGGAFVGEKALFKATRSWPVELRFGIGYAF